MRGRLTSALAVATMLVLGCAGKSTPAKNEGSALWVGPSSGPVSAETWSLLQTVGIDELFVEAGRLEWSGALPTVEAVSSDVDGYRGRVTLVVTGEWPAGEVDAGDTAGRLQRELDRLRRELESRRQLVVGYHFDLDRVRDLSALGAVLSKLRKRLRDGLWVSASVRREDIGREDLPRLAQSVDFLVPFLYGQRSSEREDPDAWDFHRLEQAVNRLEELDCPYLLGIVTVGTAHFLDQREDPVASTTEVALGTLVRDRRLRLEYGFTLEGIDRLVYAFEASSPTKVGERAIPMGSKVRVVATAPAYIEELTRLLGAWSTSHRLGDLFFRLPAESEALSMGPRALADALALQPANPEPTVEVEVLTEHRRRLWLKVRLLNGSAEASEVGLVDHNFVELRVVGGRAAFGDVDQGGFQRFDLLRPNRDGSLRRSIQDPTVVRLFEPWLGPHATIDSGRVELYGVDFESVRLQVRADYLAPGGREVDFGPVEWRPFGEDERVEETGSR